MSGSGQERFTLLLARYRDGEAALGNTLVRLVHDDLHRIARHHMRANRWIGTLSPTVVVNEVYFRLVSDSARHVGSRAHFLSLAATAMRQVICDHARRRLREQHVVDRDVDLADWDELALQAETEAKDVLWLHEALLDLAKCNPRAARVVECRFFAGLSERETARSLGVSTRTVERAWAQARNWLERHLAAG